MEEDQKIKGMRENVTEAIDIVAQRMKKVQQM